MGPQPSSHAPRQEALDPTLASLTCTRPRYALTLLPAEMPLDTMRDRVFLPTCTILVPVSACSERGRVMFSKADQPKI